MDDCIRWGWRSVIGQGKGANLGVNVRRPIITNGDFVAYLCKSA